MSDQKKHNHLTRRDFLGRAAGGAAALGLGGLTGTLRAAEAPNTEKMPLRTLGKTGAQVSLLGFGGGSRFIMTGDEAAEERAVQMLQAAVASGITYFDTAASYGRGRLSERFYGAGLPPFRKQIFLATKTGDRTYDGAMRSVEESLKLLKTDYLDLIQMHDVGPRDDPAKWDKPDGALTALRKLQDQKTVRFVGFTGHQKAEVHKNVIESLDFDTVLMALNAGEHKQFRQIALPAAVEKKMGIIGMKATRGLIGEGAGKAPAKDLLSWVWDQPVSVVIVGMETLDQLNENVRLAKTFQPGRLNTAALTSRLAPHVTAAQLGWAMPGYRDTFA